MKTIPFFFILMLLLSELSLADACSEQSFDWKEKVVEPQDNELVAHAHRIFGRLLRSWDDTRIPPALHVIETQKGPWAAAVDSGDILITLSAVKMALGNSFEEGASRLAFVLAHELIHLRSDDLWHKRFFRMAGCIDSSDRFEQFDAFKREELRKKEMRADAEGLVLMMLVGYDPVAIVGERDFFTVWAENSLGVSCEVGEAPSGSIKSTCDEARKRVASGLEQLKQLANQSLLFDLGMQAYVAGNYSMARRYFAGFGRIYPGRAVQTNIGLSYLGEAMLYKKKLASLTKSNEPMFIYPLIAGTISRMQSLSLVGLRGLGGSREGGGSADSEVENTQRSLKKASKEAILAFERALKNEPESKQPHIHLVSAYLLSNNIPMAKGKLDGEYEPRFGQDLNYKLLNAMTKAAEGNYQEAKSLLLELLSVDGSVIERDGINRETFLYTVTYNLSSLLEYINDDEGYDQQWHNLIKRSAKNGDAILFRLSLKQLGLVSLMQSNGRWGEEGRPFFIGMHVSESALKGWRYRRQAWVEGQPIFGYEFEDGLSVVLDDADTVIALWNSNVSTMKEAVHDEAGETAIAKIIKMHGVPNRTIDTDSGTYMAYDSLGMAYQVISNGVESVFHYEPSNSIR